MTIFTRPQWCIEPLRPPPNLDTRDAERQADHGATGRVAWSQ